MSKQPRYSITVPPDVANALETEKAKIVEQLEDLGLKGECSTGQAVTAMVRELLIKRRA